jgi:glycosyltransferase involved in cell wall biosynthesis
MLCNEEECIIVKKVLFFTQNRWAFGSIHHGLAKELWKHGIYANLLDWTQGYTAEEFKLLRDSYDVFVTMPDAVLALHYRYGVELERIVAVAHGQWDILLAKQQADQDFYPKLGGFGVISEVLKSKCCEWGISRIPKIAELGIHVDIYDGPVAESLEVVGYGGSGETKNWFGVEIKRPKLVELAIEKSGLELKKHQFYNHLAMPAYYKQVGAVVMGSIEEAGGLPMMECAAAGRLPIGTPVGYFEENAIKGGGVIVPMDDNEFVNVTSMILKDFKNDPRAYRLKCEMVREYARKNYDWSVKIKNWIDLFTI